MGVDVKSIYAIAFGLGAALGGLRRRVDGADLPDLAADVVGLSRQSLCRLRAWRPWQRVGCAGRRRAVGACRGRRFCHPVGLSHATTLSFALLIVFLIVRPQGSAWPEGLRMTRGQPGASGRDRLHGGFTVVRRALCTAAGRPRSACTPCWRGRGISSAAHRLSVIRHRRVFRLGSYVGAILLEHGCRSGCRRCAALVCLIVAVLIGAPILRLRGHYFAVASLSSARCFAKSPRAGPI